MDRRDFLSAACGLALASAGRISAADPKPRVGVIGCGWFGMFDLQNLLDVASVEVVGLVDPDRKMLDDAVKWVEGRGQKKPATYENYREFLKEKPDLVIVGTPDHWHALPTIHALVAGAHVYVEKPISIDVREGQAMVAAARKHNRRVQVGMQRRSTPHIIRARDFINSGAIGRVVRANAYCYYHMGGGDDAKDNPPDTSPPENLNFELWTGPAPMRPYNALIHPRSWRRFTEYSNGILGDMGVHMLDVARWILNLKQPKRIDGTGGILVHKGKKANIPDTQQVTYDFGETVVTWEHRTWGQYDGKHPWGVDFVGEKGTVRVNLDFWEHWPNWASEPAKRFEAEKVLPANDHDAKIIRANRAHMRDWLKCIADSGRPVSDIEEGHFSTNLCALGNLSTSLGRSLHWDGQTCTHDDEATKLLKRPYRGPWQHPHS